MNLAFIIVDDSELDCFVAKKIIEQKDKSIKVTAYLEASVALKDISENTDTLSDELTIILLDLRLPLMNGFEFMEEFQKLPYAIQDKYIIYVLSSTRNQSDINRIYCYKNVVRIISKPLTKSSFGSLMTEVESMDL
jgi:CheY-like chemotaxis protein